MNAPELRFQVQEAHAALVQAVNAIEAARAAAGTGDRDLRAALLLASADASALCRQFVAIGKVVR